MKLVRLAQKIVCSSHHIYMTWRPYWKLRTQRITVGLFSFYLLQRRVARLVSVSCRADSNGCCFGSSWLVDGLTPWSLSPSCISGCSLCPSPLLARRRVDSRPLVAPWTRREIGLAVLGSVTVLRLEEQVLCSPGQRLSRQWPPVPCSVPDGPTRVLLSSHWQSRPRKLLSSLLRFTPSADERSTPASPYCLTSVTVLRSSMSSPRRSWRGCLWCLLMSLPMSSALYLYRGLCPLMSWSNAVRDLLNRWASPGQRLLNSSTGRLLALTGW